MRGIVGVREILTYFSCLPLLLYIVGCIVMGGEYYFHLIYSLTAGKTYKKGVKFNLCLD